MLVAAINYPFPVLISGGIALGRTWSLAAALALCVLVLLGHVQSWWVPYFGRSTRAQRELYKKDYSRTLKVLPTGGRDVVPDVQHMVVGVLTQAGTPPGTDDAGPVAADEFDEHWFATGLEAMILGLGQQLAR